MNQFRLDLDAKRCAEAHQDAHCGKMLLELVQQLCTAFPRPTHVFDLKLAPWADLSPETRIEINVLPYDRTKAQYSNPVCVWTRATRANFDNTVELAQALAAEYRYRKGKPHGSEAALDWVVRHQAEAQVPDGPLQPFVLAMPDEYVPSNLYWFGVLDYDPTTGTEMSDAGKRPMPEYAIAAYRAYYRAEKRGYWRKSRDPAMFPTWVPAKWTKRDPPDWF